VIQIRLAVSFFFASLGLVLRALILNIVHLVKLSKEQKLSELLPLFP